MSEVDFVDTERAGKFAQHLGTKLSPVELADRVFQAIVKKPAGQLEQEVTLHRPSDSGRIELVDQDAINDRLPHFVVVPSLWLDVMRGSAESFTAVTVRRVLAVMHFPPKLPLKCYRTNATAPYSLASPKRSTFWAGSLSRVTRFSYRACGCFLASMPGSFFCVFRKPN